MRLDNSQPSSVILFNTRPIMMESGFLYFVIEPWSRAEPVYLKVRSKGTLRAIRYWLNRIADWHDVGLVTHLTGKTS